MRKIKKINSIRIKNLSGDLIKLISKKNLKNLVFGELYISKIKKNKIKGWHFHNLQTSTLIPILGKVILVIFRNKKFKTYTLDEKKISSVIIPPKSWYSFKGMKNENALLNLSNKVHDPKNSKKLDISHIPFKW